MKRDTLKDPQPGDRFVLKEEANKYVFNSATHTAKCVLRQPKTVILAVRCGGVLMPYDTWITVRLTTLAKIARPKGAA